MANPKERVSVSERTVVQRINRKLRPDHEMVRKARSARWGLGEYYQVDFNRNWIVNQNVDVESLARELGALQDWEEVAAE